MRPGPIRAAILGGQAKPSLPRYRAAIAATRANQSRTLIAFKGDSTMVLGQGNPTPSTSASYANNSHDGALAGQIEALFVNSGLPLVGYSAFGGASSLGLSNTDYQAFNPHIFLGTNWSPSSSAIGLGGHMFYNSVAGNSASFGILDSSGYFDTVEIFHPLSATATSKVEVYFGAVKAGEFSEQGANAVAKKSFTGAATTNGITLKNAAGSGTPYIIGALASKSTAKGVACLNMGWSGSTIIDWTDTSNAWGPMAAGALVGAALTIYKSGINCMVQGIPIPTMQAALRVFIDAERAAGADVVIIGPNAVDPAYSANTSLANQDVYTAAMAQVAVEKGCIFIDPKKVVPNAATFAAASAAGYMFDQLHYIRLYASLLAAAVYRAIS